jgi:hypothetical protein
MLRQQDNDIGQYVVPGSDHLTAYRIYEDALRTLGTLGHVYGLPRHVFEPEPLEAWCEERGVLVRSIEDAALAIASIFRSLDLALPRHLPQLNGEIEREWKRLLARVAPFPVVIDEETSWGEEVRVSKTSVCGSWGAVMGDLQYFADRTGRARGSISGTQIPHEMIWEFATLREAEVVYDPAHRRAPLRLRKTREFQGFVLEAEDVPIDVFPAGREEAARLALGAALAAGDAHHRDVSTNRAALRDLREVWRRSGGTVPEGGEKRIAAEIARQLEGVKSYQEFLETHVRVDADAVVPREERERWLALPDTITIGGEEYPLDYAVEGGKGIVRARVPAKAVPLIDEGELPKLDRPLHWTVTRGKREALRAASLEEALELLYDRGGRERGRGRPHGQQRQRTRDGRENGDEGGGHRGRRGHGGRKGKRPAHAGGRHKGRKGGKRNRH